jgi:hypothetical protein
MIHALLLGQAAATPFTTEVIWIVQVPMIRWTGRTGDPWVRVRSNWQLRRFEPQLPSAV